MRSLAFRPGTTLRRMAWLALACAPGASLSGCNLLASTVPCQVDDNCAPGERCREGACEVDPSRRRDAGPARDGGPIVDDGGPKDAGDGIPCEPRLVVTAGESDVPEGHPVRISLDHAALVALGFAGDGTDLHLVHDEGEGPTRIARALDPLSGWNRADTALWFRLVSALEAGASTDAYRLQSDEETAPNADEGQVFPVADFFERPDETPLEAPWSAPYGGVSVVDGGLALEPLNGDNRPFVDLELPPQERAFDLVLGWGFARIGSENEYRLHLHLGHGPSMPEPAEAFEHFADDGANVSLVWAGVNHGFAEEETLAAHVVGGYTPLAPVSGQRRMVLRVDPEIDRYDVIVDGTRIGETLPFLAAGDVLSRFRLVAWRMGGNVEQRLEYVYLLPLIASEPTVRVELPADCR